jgi:hypothetical protein
MNNPDVEMCGYYLEKMEASLKEMLSNIEAAMNHIGYRKYIPPTRPDNPFPTMGIGQILEFDRGWVSWLEKRRCYEKKKHPDKKFKFKYRDSKKVVITRIK